MTIRTDDLLYDAPVAITPHAATVVEGLVMEMIQQGWKCGARHQETEVLDKMIVDNSRCRRCGTGSLHYEPFHKGGSYKPFTICVDCGDMREF